MRQRLWQNTHKIFVQESRRIVLVMVADDVAVEKTFESVFPNWQYPEEITTRENGMQKKADSDSSAVAKCLPQIARHEEQMIVLDPYNISAPDLGRYGFGEGVIDVLVCLIV